MTKQKNRLRFCLFVIFRTSAFLLMVLVLFSLFFGISLDQRDICPEELHKEILYWAGRYGLPPELVTALIWQESRYRATAVGRHGEIGLMQLMPPGSSGAVGEWVRLTGAPMPERKTLFSPSLNLEIGCWYLASAMEHWREYRHGTALALAQYNAGAARAEVWKPETLDGEVISRINIPGTREYVKRILQKYQQLLSENNKFSQGKRK